MLTYSTALVWLRRDLRLHDQAALYYALKQAKNVIPVFVFDRAILNTLPRIDRRVAFIWETIAALKSMLQAQGSDLIVRHDFAVEALPRLAQEFGVDAVFTNHDYEPAAIVRDTQVANALAKLNIAFHTSKDQVIFERDEVMTQSGGFYSVFTPYKNAWLKKLSPFYLQGYPVSQYQHRFAHRSAVNMPNLADLGFEQTNLNELGIRTGPAGAEMLFADFQNRIDRYQDARDFPGVKGVSYLSVHLRFGTISIRELAAYAWHRGTAALRHCGTAALRHCGTAALRHCGQYGLAQRTDLA